MFALLKKQNVYAQSARAVYAEALAHSRAPYFYEEFGVPDSFDGRFDLLLLHVFLVMQRTLEDSAEQAEEFNQALFDATFADMDQTLREMGIGDMGVPKHMRKMMRGFNGRMHAYQEALVSGELQASLRRNLYGTLDGVDDDVLAKMERKVLEMLAFLKTQSSEAIFAGEIQFEKSEA